MTDFPQTTPAAPRRIAHLDMDAFYASVELLRYPELRGLPVVIGGGGSPPPLQSDGTRLFARLGDYVGRGVITTSTYEARKFGVFSAMGMMKAARLAPQAILLPTDFAAYRDCSRRFKEAVAQIVPHIEDRGIDEIYIDLSGHPEPDEQVGRRLKDAVRAATGLSCSIAIAPNKLLAKIGSELDKPDGLTLLSMDDVPARIWPLPAAKVNGIGPKSARKLEALGIETIGQLAHARPSLLQEHFGLTYASWLLRVANGEDQRPVVTHSDPKSISRETTFERDLHVIHDRSRLSEVFSRLCGQLEGDLQRKRVVGRTVGIKLRFDDFRTVTRDLTLHHDVANADAIRGAAGQCLKRVPFESRIRLLGVRISSLRPMQDASPAKEPRQLTLLD